MDSPRTMQFLTEKGGILCHFRTDKGVIFKKLSFGSESLNMTFEGLGGCLKVSLQRRWLGGRADPSSVQTIDGHFLN